MPMDEVSKLKEKIERAILILRGTRMNHLTYCHIETHPEGNAWCSCGASKTNSRLDAAIKQLSLE